jgi:hypothetical protein
MHEINREYCHLNPSTCSSKKIIYRGYSNRTHMRNNLGEGVEATKNSPHECGVTQPLDTTAYKSPLKRTICAASKTTVPP